MIQPLLRTLSCSLGIGLLSYSVAAQAADRMVLKYGILRDSVSIESLTVLAETGQVPRNLQPTLRRMRQEPEEVRKILTKPVELNAQVLNLVLTSPLGTVTLDELAEIISTPGEDASTNRQSIRSALTLAALDDNQVTLLEFLQKYPSNKMVVDVKRLLKAYEKIDNLSSQVQQAIQLLQTLKSIPLFK